MKKVYKDGTGDTIPEGAQYLSTVTQTQIKLGPEPFNHGPCWFVWHYFLVEVTE